LKEAYRQVFPSGAQIFREGEPGDIAFIIERGEVEISSLIKGAGTPLARLRAGDLFGEMALIDDNVRSATATAVCETEVIIVSRDYVKDKITQGDPLLNLFLRVILNRLRAMDHAHVGRPGNTPLDTGDDVEDVREQFLDRLQHEREIQSALESGQFELYYQPIVHLASSRIAGFESLIRWNHPRRGLVPPAEFISLAEMNGLIVPMGEWILNEATRTLEHFDRAATAKHGPLYMSINVSGRQFVESDLPVLLRRVLDSRAIAPGQVKLEITETLLMENPELAALSLKQVKDLGIRVAIDDFGTGYSSLSYLNRFPIDTLKIDRSFVTSMFNSDKSLEIVRMLTELARCLGMDIIAEGIEEETQADQLRTLGCEYGQGYLYAKPMPLRQAISLLADNALLSAGTTTTA
jgi:EAL domain-containing protein (putative c-di-GMP-specific phosphodiesterase class I)